MSVSRKSKKNLSKKKKNIKRNKIIKSNKKTRNHIRKIRGGADEKCESFNIQSEASEYIRKNKFEIKFKYEGRIMPGSVEQIGESEDKQLICKIKINKNNINLLNEEDKNEYNDENGLWIGWEDLCKPN